MLVLAVIVLAGVAFEAALGTDQYAELKIIFIRLPEHRVKVDSTAHQGYQARQQWIFLQTIAIFRYLQVNLNALEVPERLNQLVVLG